VIVETILFLIIVGILSSIFGKAKGKPTPGKTKPFTAKRFDDFRTMVEQQMGSIPKKSGQISEGQAVTQDSKFQDIELNYQEIKQNLVINRMQISQSEQPKVTRKEVESNNVSFERLDEKTIINGIIWGEILGEPRAKKPYFSKKN
jgi:hypothetical protein